MKTRIVLLIIGSILLGFVGGFFTSGQVAKKRMHKIMRSQEPKAMNQRLINTIDPDEEQEKVIRSIIKKHMERIRTERKNHHSEMKSAHESMFNEIEEVLDEDQKQRLKKLKMKMIQRRPPRFPPPRE